MRSTTFGRYREIALLGQGGMARVYLAALPGALGMQKLLVVKEMLPELAMDSEFVTMFTDEARLASRLAHPNLIHTYELAESEGRYFYVMEYVEGQPYSALMARTKRSVALALQLRILTRVLAGVHYAHELTSLEGTPLAIVHRDVTPQNIFLSYDGAIKLGDFGIAKTAGAAVRTRTGVFKGKLAYAPREQMSNEPIDRRADVFSVGVMLWEAIVGRRISHDMEEPAILARRLNGDDPKVLDVKPDAPKELAEICDKAMARDRDARFATALEMQEALEVYMETRSLRVSDMDVGRVVTDAFAIERSKVRKLVQEQLADSGEVTRPGMLILPAPATSESDVSKRLSGDLPTRTAVEIDRKSLNAAPKRGPWVAVAIVVALSAIGARMALRSPPVAETNAPSAASALIPAVAATASSTSVAASEVDVSISALPPTAQFALDGVALSGNPYTAKLPRDDKPHRVTVSAPGFVSEERVMMLGRDVHLELALQAAKMQGSPVKHPASEAPAVHPKANPTARPANSIDTSDPYGASGSP